MILFNLYCFLSRNQAKPVIYFVRFGNIKTSNNNCIIQYQAYGNPNIKDNPRFIKTENVLLIFP